MSISQIQLSRPGLDLSLPSPGAPSGGSADNALQQIVLLVLEQVVRALQDKLGDKSGSSGSGNAAGPGGAAGPGSASGAGGPGAGSSAGSGPEGLLQRFADLFKSLGESIQKSLDDQKANQFAQKLAQALGSDPKTLDKLDDGQANGSFNQLAKDFMKSLESLGGASPAGGGSGSAGSPAGAANTGGAGNAGGPAAAGSADSANGGGTDAVGELLKQLLQLLLNKGGTDGAKGPSDTGATGDKGGSPIDQLMQLLQQLIQLLQTAQKGKDSQNGDTGGGSPAAGGAPAGGAPAGGAPAGGAPAGGAPAGGAPADGAKGAAGGSPAEQIKQLLDQVSKGDNSGVDNLAKGSNGQEQIQKILELLLKLLETLTAQKSGNDGAANGGAAATQGVGGTDDTSRA